jgi:hypothetical protein
MFPAETLVVSPAVHARVRVLGRPELERTIEVPRDAPGSWLIAAYLLSIGVEQHADDTEPRLQLWGEPWNERVQVIEVPELPGTLEVTTEYARIPEAGEQQVCVLDDDAGGPPRHDEHEAPAAWWADPPPFRLDAINRELARMFGVVLPHFAHPWGSRHGCDFGVTAPIERLLADLSPLRRLALQAHLDDVVIADAPASGGESAVAATEGIRSLLDRFGPDGVAQDPATGWLPWGLLERTARDLGWVSDGRPLLPKPEAALFALARKMRLIRRLRGDVVLTNRGHELLRDPERCRRELDAVLREAGCEWSWAGPANDVTLVLLAIADGTIDAIDDITAVLERSREVLGHGAVEESGIYGALELAVPATVSAELRDLIGVLAALSPRGGYGCFTPAIRTLALAILR